MSGPAYPEETSRRTGWILARRTSRARLDPTKPYAYLLEQEPDDCGEVVSVATLFLTNRECPWRCLMCDLWKNTLTETVPLGAIPSQIDFGLAQLRGNVERNDQEDRVPFPSDWPPRQIKLYNSGSFFDSKAIPPEDDAAIASRVTRFERVIVECHPALVGDRVWRFRDRLETGDGAGQLEVAMGLETVHPDVLARLNKGMTLEQFAHAARLLERHGIALRAFVLVRPPFLGEEEALYWAQRSIDFAFDQGSTAVTLIPTRGGNGALEALAEQGQFAPPSLDTLEAAARYGVALRRGRVFADLWDLDRFSKCRHCFEQRFARLDAMNRTQRIVDTASCRFCRPGQVLV